MTDTPYAGVPDFRPRIYGIALLVAGLVVLGIWLITRYISMDLARDEQHWRDKLNLIAESRTEAVTKWVSGHFRELRAAAENPSLQLYLTELQQSRPAEAASAGAEPAQKTYLRNLLTFTAERMGFMPARQSAGEYIAANVPQPRTSGIALLDNGNGVMASSAYMPPIEGWLKDELSALPQGIQAFLDFHKEAEGGVQAGFVVPVFAIQGEREAAFQVGRVIGIKEIGEDLFGMLHHPGVTEKTLEALLVREEGENVLYLSPLADGTAAMTRTLPADPAQHAGAFAMRSPGGFSARSDYQGKPVYVTGRTVPGTPWTLLVQVSKEEALAANHAKRNATALFLFAILFSVVVTIIAVWRNASYKRSVAHSEHFREIAARATAKEELLSLVANHQPEPIYIVDEANVYRFANRRAGDVAGIGPEFMAGKAVQDVLGPARAQELLALNAKAMASDQALVHIHASDARVVRSEHVPLRHIPVEGLPQGTRGVLVTEQDVTDVVQERERRMRSQRELTDTLIRIVDKRDPYAADHSQLVAQIAQEVAASMQLDAASVETARLAGSLMNIGKIVVSEALLTKADMLSEEERQSIRESIYASADLLQEVQFDGPVVDTLRQSQEQWDGTGPLGLKDEEILVPARIIAVANAFIGMISPRSYRQALSMEETIKALMERCGTQFDRRVVIALINYLENRGGKAVLTKQIEELQRAA